jgi:hypothetical protein
VENARIPIGVVKDFNALSLLKTISHDIITCSFKVNFAHKILYIKESDMMIHCFYHIGLSGISLHGVVILLGFGRGEVHYEVHYRLMSTCEGSFTCPGIAAQVQGTTVFLSRLTS